LPTRKPQAPPAIEALLQEAGGVSDLLALVDLMREPQGAASYLHWDELRHRPPPEGLTIRQWWLVQKLARRGTPLPLLGTNGRPFTFCQPSLLLKGLQDIDMTAGGNVLAPEAVTNPHPRDRHLISTLMEEAITSSQMEGAATTRDVARDMIRSGRPPRDRSERMILNNYRTMQRIRELREEPLTPALVQELHRMVTLEALDAADAAGRLRAPGVEVVVDDLYGTVFHVPPPAEQLPERMERMCAFANGSTPEEFLHPVVRAITLHFWLAYDHPFVDGNGRTARALFYWSMLHQKYGLFEFISISSIIHKARGQYELSFLHTETDDNDLTYFLLAQVKVIQQAIASLHRYLERKAQEISTLQRRLQGLEGLNHRQMALLRHALRHPGFRYTVGSHQASHGVSNQTARTDLQKLAAQDLLLPMRQGRREEFSVPTDLARRLPAL
jgi:Fic family protein